MSTSTKITWTCKDLFFNLLSSTEAYFEDDKCKVNFCVYLNAAGIHVNIPTAEKLALLAAEFLEEGVPSMRSDELEARKERLKLKGVAHEPDSDVEMSTEEAESDSADEQSGSDNTDASNTDPGPDFSVVNDQVTPPKPKEPVYYIKEAGEYHYDQFKGILAKHGFDVDRKDSDKVLQDFSSFLQTCVDDEEKTLNERHKEAEEAMSEEDEDEEDEDEEEEDENEDEED